MNNLPNLIRPFQKSITRQAHPRFSSNLSRHIPFQKRNYSHYFHEKNSSPHVHIKSNTLIRGLGVGILAGFAALQTKDRQDHHEGDARRLEKASPQSSYELTQPTTVSGMHPNGAFVIITLNSDASLSQVAAAAAKLPGLVAEYNEDATSDKLPVLAGVSFGTHLWEKIIRSKNENLPENFKHHDSTRKGKYGDIPSTGGDIFLHVKAENQSLCFQTVKAFVDSLPKGSIKSVEDEYGWQFMEGRDLSGFIDGTENPNERNLRREAALLPSGGSYVIHQRWIHHLKEFHAKPEEEQEKIIGRTKPDSAELTGSDMPKYSHVVRTRDAEGNKIPIVRQSMPFGTLGGKHGLLFCAYSNTPKKFDIMLDRMVGKGGEENDATMTFSDCVSSQFFYCPSPKELAELAQ